MSNTYQERLVDLFARRSVRVYQEKEVDAAQVRAILEAAMAAPSAVCKDPWRFVVVRDPARKKLLVEKLPNGKMLAQAPVGIIVCGDLQQTHDQQLSFLLQDCSAAIQNILLAAGMLGLGACWLSVHPRQERIDHLRAVLNLPEQVIPIAAIALGYPAEQKEPRTRYHAEFVHHEIW